MPVPLGTSLRSAVLVEPLACCVGALAPHQVASGMRVTVFGCGPIGLLTVYLAARLGAEVAAIDPVASRLETAARLGATIFEPVAGESDIVVDAAGFPETWRGAIDAAANGGVVVVVGLGAAEGVFPMATLVRRAITIRGQFAYSRGDFADALDLLGEGDLPLDWLTTRLLADGAQAFADVNARPGEYSKVLLKP
jgi:threonine dehydrogenase-like Zn-dependent dehydrogenase